MHRLIFLFIALFFSFYSAALLSSCDSCERNDPKGKSEVPIKGVEERPKLEKKALERKAPPEKSPVKSDHIRRAKEASKRLNKRMIKQRERMKRLEKSIGK